jgi:hypothetical protein
MALKAIVDNLDDVPEEFRGEYKEQTDPKTKAVVHVLDIEGSIELHPAARVLKDELARRRVSEKKATDKLALLAPFETLGKPEDVQAQLDRIPELEALAEGKMDDTKINTLVETRIKSRLAPIERELGTWKTKATELEGTVSKFQAENKQRSIADNVRAAVSRSQGFQPVAMEDAIVFAERMLEVNEDGHVVTKDGVGVTPGVDAVVWLTEMQAKKPHWWGTTQGGGAQGGRLGGAGGANPFSHEGWNMTEQGNLVRTNRARAEQLAKSAGTSIGGKRPAPKK